jgi:hypothetical protein
MDNAESRETVENPAGITVEEVITLIYVDTIQDQLSA